jgi:fructokinase
VPDLIFVAGEALIDLVADTDGRYRPIPGGSPANVAVGLARLGVPTHLLARLGAGAFGRVVRDHLEANGVLLDLAVQAAEPTTLAVVSLAEDGGASYDFYADDTADWGWRDEELPATLPAGALALVTGSLAAAREPGASALARLVRREHQRGQATVVLDPNLRPSLLGGRDEARTRWDELVRSADVVKASDEDLRWLAPDVEPDEVAAGWATRGPAIVVLTRGAQGATGWTRRGARVDVGSPPVEVVDTIGAGDAFTAGLVDSLRLAGLLGATGRPALGELDETTLRPILDRAALTAALTCERPGADPPTAQDLAPRG